MNEQSNIYLPHLMVIEKITHEAPGVKTFRYNQFPVSVQAYRRTYAKCADANGCFVSGADYVRTYGG